MAQVRLQKILAQAGVASRRKAEEYITQGRVRVDGQIVSELGAKSEPSAKIELDGKRLVRSQLCYGVLHKPRGMLTTLSDPEGRPHAGEILGRIGLRVVPVGRLDFNTSGVLLFTNDGDFAQALTHAKSRAQKVYLAKVRGELREDQLTKWAEKIEIDGRMTEPANVRALRREAGHTWLEITLLEGRNRQVRRLGEHAGSMVVRLVRLSHAGITVEGLRTGEFRLLTSDELKTLKANFGEPKRLGGVITNLADLPQGETRPIRRAPRSSERTRRSTESREVPRRSGDNARRVGESREGAPRTSGLREGTRGSSETTRRTSGPREGTRGSSETTRRTSGPREGTRGASEATRRTSGPREGTRRPSETTRRTGEATGVRRGPAAAKLRGDDDAQKSAKPKGAPRPLGRGRESGPRPQKRR